MIGLVSLLKEIQGKPKAIFMAGPAGSGKSFIASKLIPSNFNSINSDDTYEELLKATGLGLKQKDFTPDQLSQAAKLQSVARKETDKKYQELTKNLQNVIIDGTGAATKPLLKKKEELEALGYDTFMVMTFVPVLVSLERNMQRDRSLMPSIVLRTWRDVNKNIDTYKKTFDDNISIVNTNTDKDLSVFSKDKLKKYFEQSKAVGKPKTPEEQQKSQAEKEQLVSDIEQMSIKLPTTDTLEQSKTKITNFISK
jgi:cytidylate kinase